MNKDLWKNFWTYQEVIEDCCSIQFRDSISQDLLGEFLEKHWVQSRKKFCRNYWRDYWKNCCRINWCGKFNRILNIAGECFGKHFKEDFETLQGWYLDWISQEIPGFLGGNVEEFLKESTWQNGGILAEFFENLSSF